MHHAYILIYPKIYKFHLYSNPQGGCGGLIFSFNFVHVQLDSDLPELFTNFADFLQQFLQHPVDLLSYFLHISTFSSDIKRVQ